MTETTIEPVVEEPKVKPAYEFPFKVGADPEFTVVSGSRPMSAIEIFTTFFKGEAKTPAGFAFPGGDIGWDGHNATGELRPDPGTPREVVANMKALFKQAADKIPFVDMSTLTIAASAGGHIHLAIPEDFNQMWRNRTEKWAAIERAVGTFIILIMMGENKLSSQLRKGFQSGHYGELFDFRIDTPRFKFPSGADGFTLEVRAPGAEWVTTEKIALGTLAYMAICWDSILKGNLKPVGPVLFRSQKQAKEYLPFLLDNYVNIQKSYLDKIRPFVRAHPAYPEYKAELELIMSPSRVMEEKVKAHYSINEGWGFTQGSAKIPTTFFFKDEEIEEKTSKFPEAVIRNMSQFAWNEDLNVEQFATALSKRCIALGWKPQHEYYLFGLKKGLNALVMRDENGLFIAGHEIITTIEDFSLLSSKFDRIGNKSEAVPMYGRVLNARTGKLISSKDNRRVMIGLPYEMRRKGDIKPLIRLVLKFEKSPKTFIPLDSATLSLGPSPLLESMKKEEEMEVGLERAESRADNPRQLSNDAVQAEMETNPESYSIDSAISGVIRDLSRAMSSYAGSSYVKIVLLMQGNGRWNWNVDQAAQEIVARELVEYLSDDTSSGRITHSLSPVTRGYLIGTINHNHAQASF